MNKNYREVHRKIFDAGYIQGYAQCQKDMEEPSSEIEVGDEVTTKDVKRKGIVIRIASVCSLNTGKIENEYTIWTGATIYRAYEGDDIQKTGKYFLQIPEIIKQLEGE